MAEQIDHNCGVVAVVDLTGKRDVVPDALHMAEALQHRGQLAYGRAGIPLDGGPLWHRTNMGRVDESIAAALKEDPKSAIAIAHTRYATNGCLGMAHPVVVRNAEDESLSIAFAFNGNIPDISPQAKKLSEAGVKVPKRDTEVLAHLLALRLRTRKKSGLRGAIESLGTCDGAMNGVVLTGAGEVAAFRDAHGFHPLVQARHDGKFAVASEDYAIRQAWPGCTDIQPVKAGHMMTAFPGMKPRQEKLWDQDLSHCFFEWIYFANSDTMIDGSRVHRARSHWGMELARLDASWDAERLIAPVPDSARSAALAYAYHSRQRYADVLLRTQEGRTFIEPNNRAQKVIEKFAIDPLLAERRDLVIVEDSIVRGTTMRGLIARIRAEARPSSLHVRIACPPITNPCYYGIDFKTKEELLVPRHTERDLQGDGTLPLSVLDSIARDLRVDSIRFLPLPAVAQGINKSIHDLCTACVTGRYPTAKGQELHQLSLRKH